MLCFLPSMHQCIDLQSRCGLMEAYERARQEARGGIRSPIGSDDTRATAVIKINTSESERYTFSIRCIKGRSDAARNNLPPSSTRVTQRARGSFRSIRRSFRLTYGL